jgi:ubiquinone/menaquinone biosynthesis C-methylase UbiE
VGSRRLPEDDRAHLETLRSEFDRAASSFDARTVGRFDHLDVVAFSRTPPGATVLEVGAGTGGFLSLFDEIASLQIGVDLTPGMLAEMRRTKPHLALVLADGARLPIRSATIDLAASAQMFHHVHQPGPILKEMRRVVRPEGHALVLDQAAPERVEEIEMMHRLEVLRDPSHAATRPPSALRIMAQAAGFEIEDEKLASSEQRLSTWMWPGEFPDERIEAVKDFIAEHGAETGMGFEPDEDDWVFERRRMMLLLKRA